MTSVPFTTHGSAEHALSAESIVMATSTVAPLALNVKFSGVQSGPPQSGPLPTPQQYVLPLGVAGAAVPLGLAAVTVCGFGSREESRLHRTGFPVTVNPCGCGSKLTGSVACSTHSGNQYDGVPVTGVRNEMVTSCISTDPAPSTRSPADEPSTTPHGALSGGR